MEGKREVMYESEGFRIVAVPGRRELSLFYLDIFVTEHADFMLLRREIEKFAYHMAEMQDVDASAFYFDGLGHLTDCAILKACTKGPYVVIEAAGKLSLVPMKNVYPYTRENGRAARKIRWHQGKLTEEMNKINAELEGLENFHAPVKVEQGGEEKAAV